jgi:Ni2+-binding GTPase involved in maturation of urease and hydrogenase
MKMLICAGTPTSGKTMVLKHVVQKIIKAGCKPAFIKIDVQFADEDQLFRDEFSIPARKIYSGELCPDHCNVMVVGDALDWAEKEGCNFLIVETAGLCLRCSPYVENSPGIVVLEATSGMNLPRKVGPMLSLADIAVVTKIDLISQAEREVFRARVLDAAPKIMVCESDALHGIGLDAVARYALAAPEVQYPMYLRGNPPVGTCTICVGKKEIGWKQHFGVVRPMESELFYRGE